MTRGESPLFGALVWLGRAAVLLPVVLLVGLVVALAEAAARAPSTPALTTSAPAELSSAVLGSVALTLTAALAALPVGLGAALYLELWPRTPLARLSELAVERLAAVPSVVWGLLGLALLVEATGRGASWPALSIILALTMLPVAALSARDALRRVPRALRESAEALGATRAATLGLLVLPTAAPALLAGALITLARGLAETVGLLLVGVLDASSGVTVLGATAFVGMAHRGDPEAAAGALLVLVVLLGALHLGAALADRRLPRGGPR